jgi:hypothetical protein
MRSDTKGEKEKNIIKAEGILLVLVDGRTDCTTPQNFYYEEKLCTILHYIFFFFFFFLARLRLMKAESYIAFLLALSENERKKKLYLRWVARKKNLYSKYAAELGT